MEKEKISIIMSCYNCEKTMKKAIDSIINQTYDNWIMICCDDGSADNTFNILKEYEANYPEKFLVIRNEINKQLPFSLNHCLEYVETDLVARMDADDWCLPERLEKQAEYLKDHPDVDMVGTGISVFDGEKIVTSIIRPEFPKAEEMLVANCFSHGTVMLHKRVYDELNGYSLDESVIRVEDVDLWCRFFAAGFTGHNLKDELYIILEDNDAVKRRSLKNRVNEAKTRTKGYRLMGLSGIRCYKPYLDILKFFVPLPVYKYLHVRKLNRQSKR